MKETDKQSKPLNYIIRMKPSCPRYASHKNVTMLATKEVAEEFCERNKDYYFSKKIPSQDKENV